MSKLLIIVWAVIGCMITDSEALGGNDPVKTVQLNVQRLINRKIETTRRSFDDEKKNFAEIGNKFRLKARQFKKPIMDEIVSIVQKIDFEASKISRNSGDYITADCTRYYENLVVMANFVESNTSVCVDEKLKTRLDFIESIVTMFQDELNGFESMLNETEHCSDNITDVKTAFKAMECARAVKVRADKTAEAFDKTLNNRMASLNTSLRLFPTIIENCSKTNGLDDFKLKSKSVVRKTRECIQRNDQQNNYDVRD